MTAAPITTALLALYNRGGPYSAAQLASVYSDDIHFRDPAHTLTGLAALCDYLNHQYSNVHACTFVATGEWASGDYMFLQWDMHLQHPKLNGGNPITVTGLSQLQCRSTADGSPRITQHRDYFDLGQLLYEHVPLLGALNRRLKQGMAS